MFIAKHDYVHPDTQEVIIYKDELFGLMVASYLLEKLGIDTFYTEDINGNISEAVLFGVDPELSARPLEA
jgi:hypothetical protein